MEQPLTGRIAVGLLWIGGGRASQAVLRLLVLIVLARLLPPADFGVVSAAMVVIGFSLIFSQLGLGPAIIQRPELEPGHIDTAFVTSAALGVALGGLMWWSAPAAARVFPQVEGLAPVLRALAWVFPLVGLSIVSDSLIQRELRFRFLATADVVTFAIGYGVVGVTLAILKVGVWALVAAQLVQTALHTTIFLVARPPRLRLAPSRRALRELLYFGGGFTASKIANFTALQGDNLVVGRWLGAEALGLYGRAYELMSAPVYLLGEALDQVLFPILARVQGDARRLALVFLRGVGLIALAMLPATVVLFAVAPEFIDVVLGPRWAGVVAPFQVLALGMFLRTSYRMSDALARATGAVYRRAWRQAVYAALVILGAWIGQHWGIAGVAVGVLAALIANFLLMAHLSLRLGGLSWGRFWEAHRPALRLTAGTGVVAWTLTAILRHGGAAPAVLLTLVLGGAAGCILLLAWASPRAFLGPDGLWLLDAVRDWSAKWTHPLGRSVAVTPPPAPSLLSQTAAAPVSLVGALGDALDLANVRYCQWKGHAKAARWARGDGDVDLLVDRADSGRFSSVLGNLGFKEALVRPDRQVPGIHTFYGLDPLTYGLIHLHVHYLLVFGRRPIYRLPLETPLLDSAVRNGGRTVFRTPAPELEFLLLVLRLVERYSLRDALRPGQPLWLTTMLGEARSLGERVDPARSIAAAQKHLRWIDAPFWAACQEALRTDLPRLRRLALHRRLRQHLRPYALSQDAAAALADVIRRSARKRPASGGMIVALVGGDGAGKSTCAAALDAWLGKAFETIHAHLGRPPRSLVTLAVGAVLTPARLLEGVLTAGKGSLALVRLIRLVRHLCTARDRYRLARKVQRFAAQGGVAICERYPVPPELVHVEPRIRDLVHTVPWRRVATLLRDSEADYYRRIPPADLLVVLQVAPETAVQRKTTEPPDYVRSRAHALARVDWTGNAARIVDANRPLPQVVAELKGIVWSRL